MIDAPAIAISGRYDIAGEALFLCDFQIAGGAWNCLLGASGIGKSTILRLILGLETPGAFSGNLCADDGQDLPSRASYMAQSDLLLPWLSVVENVIIGARLRGEQPNMARAETLIGQVGLSEHRMKRPRELSGGMRQRAALARTLMEDQPIVLLDEPFSALDAGTRADMQDLAAEVLSGKTVILVTHDPAEASRLGEQIFVMEKDATRPWPALKSAPIRPSYDPEVLACQEKLMAHLRGHHIEKA